MLQIYKPILNNKQFLYLWASQVLSQMTINLMNFVLLLKLFASTGSTVATSLLWIAYALPAVFAGPIGAASVDIFEKRKILMITNFLQSALIFSFAFFHPSRIFLLYGVVVGYSFLNQFYVPAEASSLPYLVQKKNLPVANGLFFITQQVSLILGYGVAGFFYKYMGMKNTLYLCAFFLLLAFLSVSLLRRISKNRKISSEFEKSFSTFFARIIEGYTFIKNNNSVLIPFAILMSFQIGLSISTVVIPVLAEDVFGIDIASAGVAVIVPAAIGAITSAVFIPRLISHGWRKRKIITNSIRLMLLGLATLALLVPQFNNVLIRLPLAFLVMIVLGFSFVGVVVPSQTYLQEATPGGLRGRVFGNYWFLVTIATIFPIIFAGSVAEVFGIRILLLAFMFILAITLFFSAKIVPSSARSSNVI